MEVVLHPDDLDLLQRIRDGERVFSRDDGEPYNKFELRVLRLLDLRQRHLITMRPDPIRSSQSADRPYIKTGRCGLTLAGQEALARYGS
jgi:hypothetical protein